MPQNAGNNTNTACRASRFAARPFSAAWLLRLRCRENISKVRKMTGSCFVFDIAVNLSDNTKQNGVIIDQKKCHGGSPFVWVQNRVPDLLPISQHTKAAQTSWTAKVTVMPGDHGTSCIRLENLKNPNISRCRSSKIMKAIDVMST